MAVAKIEGFPLFVAGGLPGEEAVIKIMKVGKSFGYARLEKLLTTSPDRVKEVDHLGMRAGTMPLQHLSYEGQLRFKQNIVKQDLTRIGKLPDVEVLPVIGMDNPWRYRNKAQIPVRQKNGKLITGFFRKNTHTLIEMDDFHIQDAKIDEAIIKVRDILQKHGVQAYDEETHKGAIRHIMVRRGTYTNEMMIVLITRSLKLPFAKDVIQDILEELPEVVSVVQNINQERTNVILGEKTK